MSKVKQYTKFTKSSAGEIRKEIDKVLKQLEAFGLDANIGNITFNEGEIRTKLTIQPKNKVPTKVGVAKVVPQGSVVITPSMNNKAVFDALVGQKVRLGDGSLMTLVDFKARNTKYPFIVEGVRGGRYKVARSQMRL